uniref:WAP domain-containing protein n=1 Tax=Nothobranchius furzeri TaxID=105023 RepID=A0A8C6PFY2_NOTFU
LPLCWTLVLIRLKSYCKCFLASALTRLCFCFVFLLSEPPPKPGQCPHTLYTFPSRLGCSSDQDCEDYEKCCTYNCGSVCVAPHYSEWCRHKQFNISPYDQECECDDDCKRGKKCCFNGCAKECMPPKIGELGTIWPHF